MNYKKKQSRLYGRLKLQDPSNNKLKMIILIENLFKLILHFSKTQVHKVLHIN